MRISDWSSDVCSADLVQLVVEQVVVLGLLRQCVQQIALRGSAAQLQVVKGVFVAFELNDFEAVGNSGLRRCWPTILPVGRKDHFLKPRFEDGFKVFTLFDQDVIPTTAILTIDRKSTRLNSSH